jgi:hypothetical protein
VGSGTDIAIIEQATGCRVREMLALRLIASLWSWVDYDEVD